MANAITAAKAYVPMLDAVYKASAKSSVLDIAPAMVKAGSGKAGSFLLPNISLVGMGTYTKGTGAPAGDATFEWTEYTYAANRGRKFAVDEVDNIDTAGMAFGMLAGEFIRTQVVSEIDAYRFAKIAGTSGITAASGTLSSAASTLITALNVAQVNLDEAEVDDTNRLLFITPTLASLARNYTPALGAPKTDIFDRCQVVEVPVTRFYSTCTLNAGSAASAGGFANAGSALNFILMDKGAVFSDAKHVRPKIVDPATNQTSDDWMFHYHIYHDCWVYDQKVTGVYKHSVT